VRGGVFHAIAGEPLADIAVMRAAVADAFDHDYWRRPSARFPYSAALVEAALSPAVWYPALVRATAALGWPRYRLLFTLPEVRRDLAALYDRFARLARSRGLAAVIAFIPNDHLDTTSGARAITAATEAQRQAITFINVGAGFDWGRYRGPTCHPNADGYRMIAADVAGVVQPMLGTR
jgi:hypothetical protein